MIDPTILHLAAPDKEVGRIQEFLTSVFKQAHTSSAVIGVSGGIDSALSLTLLAKAVPKENIYPVLLPYHAQSVDDAKMTCTWCNIPQTNWIEHNIGPEVDMLCGALNVGTDEHIRSGNIMARIRMLMLFDIAKSKTALVCGTENKSEKYLGYFTRFGDEASDIEPLQHLYKTQVRQLSTYLTLPSDVLVKKPSAELWKDQTDEEELGFLYEDADMVMSYYMDLGMKAEDIAAKGVDKRIVDRVIARITSQQFKHEVPYTIT